MCLKVAKNIDLERSHRRKELSLRVVVGVSQTSCDDHVTVYTNIESSCCPPGSNVSYASFIAKEREKEHTPGTETARTSPAQRPPRSGERRLPAGAGPRPCVRCPPWPDERPLLVPGLCLGSPLPPSVPRGSSGRGLAWVCVLGQRLQPFGRENSENLLPLRVTVTGLADPSRSSSV